jgi:hypothetical protein
MPLNNAVLQLVRLQSRYSLCDYETIERPL